MWSPHALTVVRPLLSATVACAAPILTVKIVKFSHEATADLCGRQYVPLAMECAITYYYGNDIVIHNDGGNDEGYFS